LMFTESDGSVQTSDYNYFIQPYTEKYITMQPADWKPMNLAAWQAFSGQDAHSKAAWFTLAEAATPITELFVNDTDAQKTFSLTRDYVDLDQNPVSGTIELGPYSSRVLVVK
jgi:hypothetical protein